MAGCREIAGTTPSAIETRPAQDPQDALAGRFVAPERERDLDDAGQKAHAPTQRVRTRA